MGGSGSSSRRKSSKRRRKRDRVSSQKKRSRRKESRKRQRRCDSSSSYSSGDSLNSGHNKNLSTSSDDQSMSSDSDSEFAYDRRHKYRRARQSQLSLKSTTKGRERKRFAITSSDSDAGNVRKSKRSRKDKYVKTRKKSSKKRSRKHLSSSSSYDSESCSTWPSRSSSDGNHLKSEAVADKERARGRESHKAHKRRRIRSPSYSSHSSGSNQSVGVNHGGGPFPSVNNHRRLRSVITIADQSCNEETNRWEMDPQKEEIVYDKEDCPSPRSLDSNEHATKMEPGNDYHDPLSNRACVEDIAGEKASETVYVGDHQSKRSHNVAVKDNDVSVPAAALDDLESSLRQKALENLRKFRGELPSISLKAKNNGSDVNVMATHEANNKSGEQASSDVQIRDSAHFVEVQTSLEDKHNEKEYGMIEQNAVNPHDGPAHLGCSKEDQGTSSQTVLLPTGDAVATNACGSSPMNPTASVGILTVDNCLARENKTTDGSQFEQRTMSVMRGGEMMQVSYKVYIPKRAPALARRQLKR